TLGMLNPAAGSDVKLKPSAARLIFCSVVVKSPTKFGSSALRDTARWLRACATNCVMLTGPRLYSRPRAIASLSGSGPVNRRPAPLRLPVSDRLTCTVGLSVFTLVVAPGTAVSVAVAEPAWAVRPDKGNGAACEAGPAPCANTVDAMATNKPRTDAR